MINTEHTYLNGQYLVDLLIRSTLAQLPNNTSYALSLISLLVTAQTTAETVR